MVAPPGVWKPTGAWGFTPIVAPVYVPPLKFRPRPNSHPKGGAKMAPRGISARVGNRKKGGQKTQRVFRKPRIMAFPNPQGELGPVKKMYAEFWPQVLGE